MAAVNEPKLLEAAKAAYKAVDDKFGKDINLLHIAKISVMADYFLIASGANANQLRSMADAAEKVLSEHGIFLRHSEGTQTSRWILLDFGYIVVHLFITEERQFYNLDKIWADGEQIMVDIGH